MSKNKRPVPAGTAINIGIGKNDRSAIAGGLARLLADT